LKVPSIHPEFEQYRKYWGALQAQGMLLGMSRGNAGVMQQVQESMSGDLRRVYGEQLDKKRGHWFVLGKDATGKRFKRSFTLSRWLRPASGGLGGVSFYIYDLLRLLPMLKSR